MMQNRGIGFEPYPAGCQYQALNFPAWKVGLYLPARLLICGGRVVRLGSCLTVRSVAGGWAQLQGSACEGSVLYLAQHRVSEGGEPSWVIVGHTCDKVPADCFELRSVS